MRAVVLTRLGQALVLEERPRPKPQGEGLPVRVLAAGVCHTDVHIVDGRFPHVPLPLVLQP